jgi:Uncharacterized conserved protein (DUF2075)
MWRLGCKGNLIWSTAFKSFRLGKKHTSPPRFEELAHKKSNPNMAKCINIYSLLQASETLDQARFNNFKVFYGVEIKAAEIDDLRYMAEALRSINPSVQLLNQFYVGYKIPQIGKEFDLLRFGESSVINIELKQLCVEEKIFGQLLRNKYYLSFIGRAVYAFTYVSASNQLYFLDDNNQLIKVEHKNLVDVLQSQKLSVLESADDLFNPSDYLVSPFNSTAKFLSRKYFLTHQQEEVKEKIISQLASPKATRFFSITGSAGTGKTLLTYDIARHLIENQKKPLIIHCGNLNDGQGKLIGLGWEIVPVKHYGNRDLAAYDLIIIDEAQRIFPHQLEKIIEQIKQHCGTCLFSYDKFQTLSNWEEKSDASSKISSIKSITSYRLSEKIRTNKEIAAFIKMLFNKKRNLAVTNTGNIEISYFNSTEDAKNYLDSLTSKKLEVLRFTPSQYDKEHHEKYSAISNKNSHLVIGQEFDGVAVTIDKHFSYNEDGDLVYKGKSYYNAEKMLFQNITRSRKYLNLVIIDNYELLDRCIHILQ